MQTAFSTCKVLALNLLVIVLLASCASPSPLPSPSPTYVPYDPSINLDAETQALLARARRSVFLIPFSHWDTDWHDTFDDYSSRADQNILAAIQLAKENPRFRYTLEQVLFVQHFWDTHPERRADLKALVQNRQITFSWAGITQPETSLAAPGVQLHNLLLGREWIIGTFGPEAVPASAWQSDAFGSSAALPLFLRQSGISFLYVGRWQGRCDPFIEECQEIPHAFYWNSPLNSPGGEDTERVLVASLSYLTAWAALLNKNTPEEQIEALQTVIDEQFARTTSRYLFVPYGFDFLNPSAALLDLVERWNTVNQDTALVVSDSQTAFQYLASEELPELTVDLNPLWQAFYGTRPYARIADKETEFYLTAADKFGSLLDGAPAGEWETAAINAHYDNISAVSYDQVWEATQRPRFEESVRRAADDLVAVLAGIAGRASGEAGLPPSMLIFNSLSWPRGGVLEINGEFPESDLIDLPGPQQRTGPDTIAFLTEPIPPIGYATVTPQSIEISHPASARRELNGITLDNGLVSVSLDAGRGGTFASLSLPGEPPIELLAGQGDDLVYIEDTGDVYGARFGEERARQSLAPAQVEVLAEGPLVARARVTFSLGEQPIIKTITLYAGSPLIEVTLQMKTLPETTALMQTPTTVQTDMRTDDLGFAAFEHRVDTRPIQPGDITYRRKIFYPITYWTDVSSGGYGLSLITHGLQGVGGATDLSLLLARSVSDAGDPDHEGVTDTDLHKLRYAYYPHLGGATKAQPWKEAYAFNQPLILVGRQGDSIKVQLPFREELSSQPSDSLGTRMPETLSLASSDGGVLVDLFAEGNQVCALVIDYDPLTPTTLQTTFSLLTLPAGWLSQSPLDLRP